MNAWDHKGVVSLTAGRGPAPAGPSSGWRSQKPSRNLGWEVTTCCHTVLLLCLLDENDVKHSHVVFFHTGGNCHTAHVELPRCVREKFTCVTIRDAKRGKRRKFFRKIGDGGLIFSHRFATVRLSCPAKQGCIAVKARASKVEHHAGCASKK